MGEKFPFNFKVIEYLSVEKTGRALLIQVELLMTLRFFNTGSSFSLWLWRSFHNRSKNDISILDCPVITLEVDRARRKYI